MRELQIAYNHLQEAELDTISALVNSIEAKDHYTRGHSEHVQEVSVAIARKLKLDEATVLAIARSAILHDIGKLGISDAILAKDGPLTDEEWEILKSHPKRTQEILAPLKFLAKETRIASLHHERHDGKGYLTGAKGNKIPLETRIIAIADAFDAMDSDRPYRRRLTRDAIISELKKGRDLQHSAPIVDALLSLLEEQPHLWHRDKR